MFFFAFGGLWLALWARAVFAVPDMAYAVIATISLVLLIASFRVYRVNAAARDVEPAATRRRIRGFHIVNALQWALLVIVGNLLVHLGLAVWVIPAALLIVGLHFLPLARLFGYPPHVMTGAALIAVAVAYPLLAPTGPASPVGCLCAGVILWASGAWAVTGGTSKARSR